MILVHGIVANGISIYQKMYQKYNLNISKPHVLLLFHWALENIVISGAKTITKSFNYIYRYIGDVLSLMIPNLQNM